MPQNHVFAERLMEMLIKLFSKIHRTMPPAGTADGYRQVSALAIAVMAGQPIAEEVADVVVHALNFFVLFQPFDNAGVTPGQGA